jgi:2-amino-4-hydroxy-6-hydroxymethyldihydropteridine diphosphokinase
MSRAYLSLGSNLGDRAGFLCDALSLLSKLDYVTIEKVSSIYETDPQGYLDQADFLNIVCSIETELTPEELLSATGKIESILGRERSIRFGPRTIDIDILTFENEVRSSEKLTLPHPRMLERQFVLIPLHEIMPENHSASGSSDSVRFFGTVQKECWQKSF